MTKVVVRLNGGLGNQMFQYATGRAFSRRHGAELLLDLSEYSNDNKRHYELGIYPIEARIATSAELAAFESRERPRGFMGRIRERLHSPPHIYREPHYHFDRRLAEQRPPVYLQGYWQTEQYFADAAGQLRKELAPREPLEPANAQVAAAIGAVTAVSLHVRRGDYVSEAHTNAYHGVCSLDYYREAVELIAKRVPDAHLFVFSDDHEWTRENLAPGLPTTYVDANPPDRGFRDMQLMMQCRHHIIANSSFSWWGAWLNPSPDKIVVAPRQWFAASDNNPKDLIPPAWVRL
ncbi:MAG TPA: alpha-1,2-fucosyltransferase [Acetobacteraceae bacterium]|nr:alpha-1,2-fucosyltransferase [Acetobacteraceae bacterium]